MAPLHMAQADLSATCLLCLSLQIILLYLQLDEFCSSLGSDVIARQLVVDDERETHSDYEHEPGNDTCPQLHALKMRIHLKLPNIYFYAKF